MTPNGWKIVDRRNSYTVLFLTSLKKKKKKNRWSNGRSLLLSSWHFFDEDTIHCIMPTGEGVSGLIWTTFTFPNPESHSHPSLLNVFAVTFNMAVTVKIMVFACSHVEYSVDSSRRAALGSIEDEIPATTAAVTSFNPEVTSVVDMEDSVRVFLYKVTVLKRINKNEMVKIVASVAVWNQLYWWKFFIHFFLLHKYLAHLHESVLNLSHLFLSRCTPSSLSMKPVVAFHRRLCPLALLFVRQNPGSQVLPLLLSFHQHHVVPGFQFSPGYPGLHLDQVPQELLGHMSCMSTSRFVRHYHKMDKMKQTIKKKKRQREIASSSSKFYL